MSIAPDRIQQALTWPALAALEPRLLELERIAKASRVSRRHSDFWRRWTSLERRLSALVGWAAANPVLSSGDAYEVAHRHLLGVYELGRPTDD